MLGDGAYSSSTVTSQVAHFLNLPDSHRHESGATRLCSARSQPFVHAFAGPSLLEPSPRVMPPFGGPIPLTTVPIVMAPTITPVTTKKRVQKFESSSICSAAAASAAARRDWRRTSSWDCVLNVDVGLKFGSGFEEYWFALKMPPGGGPLVVEEEEEGLFGDEPP